MSLSIIYCLCLLGALNLDIILMDMDMGKGKYGHFPVSTALFSSKLSGLDLSRFLSVLLDRCVGPDTK